MDSPYVMRSTKVHGIVGPETICSQARASLDHRSFFARILVHLCQPCLVRCIEPVHIAGALRSEVLRFTRVVCEVVKFPGLVRLAANDLERAFAQGGGLSVGEDQSLVR